MPADHAARAATRPAPPAPVARSSGRALPCSSIADRPVRSRVHRTGWAPGRSLRRCRRRRENPADMARHCSLSPSATPLSSSTAPDGDRRHRDHRTPSNLSTNLPYALLRRSGRACELCHRGIPVDRLLADVHDGITCTRRDSRHALRQRGSAGSGGSMSGDPSPAAWWRQAVRLLKQSRMQVPHTAHSNWPAICVSPQLAPGRDGRTGFE